MFDASTRGDCMLGFDDTKIGIFPEIRKAAGYSCHK